MHTHVIMWLCEMNYARIYMPNDILQTCEAKYLTCVEKYRRYLLDLLTCSRLYLSVPNSLAKIIIYVLVKLGAVFSMDLGMKISVCRSDRLNHSLYGN